MKVTPFILAVGALTASVCATGPEGSGLIVLDGSGSGALTMVGNARVEIPAKAVYVNSTSKTAVDTTGTAKLDAPYLYVVGDAKFSGQSHCTGDVIRTGVPCADPLSSLQFPSPQGMTELPKLTITGGTHTLQPGYFKGGIDISGQANITMAPGVYILGSDFKLSSGTVLADGVSIVMLSGSFDVTGASTITWNPPSSGAMQGIVYAQPPTNTNQMKFAGGSGVQVTGTIYNPKGTTWLTGNSTVEGEGPLMGDIVIAHRVRLTGTALIRIGRADMVAIVPPKLPLAD